MGHWHMLPLKAWQGQLRPFRLCRSLLAPFSNCNRCCPSNSAGSQFTQKERHAQLSYTGLLAMILRCVMASNPRQRQLTA